VACVAVLATSATLAERWPPPRSPTSTETVAVLGSAAQPRVGCVIKETEPPSFLARSATDGPTTTSPVTNSCEFRIGGPLWSDTTTKGSIIKSLRVLKLHVLKQIANTTSNKLFGNGQKPITMVFLLKKFPPNVKALRVQLPHSLAQQTEGLFLKTATGKKVLSVQFGRGDMEVDALVTNAFAVTSALRKSLDTHLVREMTVEVDRLALPIWNQRISERGKQKVSMKSSRGHKVSKMSSMAPPIGPPLKRVRTI